MTDIKHIEQTLLAELKLVPMGTESGPVVDRFYYRVPRGARISDIKGAIAKSGLYADWCRGERGDQIAIEVPRKNPDTVSLKELLACPQFCESTDALPIILGIDTSGKLFVADLATMPHLMIVGNAGTGKSTFMNSIVASIKAHTTTDMCEFITPKPDTATSDMAAIVEEMERRYEVLSKDRTARMPRLVVLIDDIVDMMSNAKKGVTESLIALAGRGRGVGIHIIIATSRMDAKTVPGIIKANFPVRVVFRMDRAATSRQALGESGAELLLPYGDALFSEAGRIPIRIHTPYFDA